MALVLGNIFNMHAMYDYVRKFFFATVSNFAPVVDNTSVLTPIDDVTNYAIHILLDIPIF